MAIKYDKLIDKAIPDVWYTSVELQRIWGVGQEVQRARIQALVKRKDFIRRGKTADTQYKVSNKHNKTVKVTIEKPEALSSLEELINAATTLGTENALMRKALNEAKATIEKALEST
jgi:hypothetical protein